MRVTISKILNKTDLAQSGSHGGLVVTKNEQQALKDFFESPGQDKSFLDTRDQESFNIHYQDYTSNGTTPNDRVTPIGKYATKHKLTPGDVLILEKIETTNEKKYIIEYARKMSSVFFTGKSRTTVDILNFEQLLNILTKNVQEGTIKKVSNSEYEMSTVYLGIEGCLKIQQCGEDFELYFNDVSISENKKYYELDTSTTPFRLKKSESWTVSVYADEDISQINQSADDELISELAGVDDTVSNEYTPLPECKAPQIEHKGKMVPARNRQTAQNALARAKHRCEVGEHRTFIRKSNNMPYTEPHHLIPLQYDSLFEYSLDVEANIVSLCSNCHNQIHYGSDVEGIIRKLWNNRESKLSEAGLGVMKNGVVLTIEILLSFYGV